MALNYEYGINTGNRFCQFIDHEEDPDEFIAQQVQTEDKTKKSKDTKPTSAATKKSTTKSSTTATTSSTTATGATTKSNKENVTGKSSGNEQRKQQTVAFSDNQQQGGGRPESGRGAGRGGSYPRRGGSAGPDRGGRGGGNPRYNRAEGQQTGGFEQGADSWTTEGGNDNQTFSGGRGRGRGNYEGGRGNYEGGRGSYEGGRGNYEGGRGRGRGNYEGNRGRGRGGRGRGFNNSNRQFNDAPQGQDQENSTWEQTAASNFESRGPTGAADSEIPISPQGQTFDSEQSGGRGGRGGFRSRTFRSNRNQGERSHHYERGDQEQQGGHDEFRQNRRAHDRQPRNFVSSVKPIEKKDGQGAHNWGDQTEVPEEEPVAVEENAEGTTAPATTTNTKDWSQRVDEEEQKLMTFDEYKKQVEEKKKQTSEKLPQFNRRTAGEGEDPQAWKPPQEVYRKKNEDEATDEDEEEGDSQGEEAGSEDEGDEQVIGKKKIIQIPLRFKPIETPRGASAGRGGRRGPRPPSDRPAPHDEQGQATQQQTAPAAQPTGDEERPQSGYRGGRGAGGSRGAGRGEYRRSYGNAARGSRGGQYSSGGKSGDATSKFDFGNTDEFPTLAK